MVPSGRLAIRLGPALAAAILALGPTTPVAASPHGATVKAVVVRSWGGCDSAFLIWGDLNANWSRYGSVPISIDYSDQALCGSTPITLAALEANGADVVIISDPAGGGGIQYTGDEINALRHYAQEGHNVIGTYLVFGGGNVDNSPLALLFGLQPTGGYDDSMTAVTPTYAFRALQTTLFRNISNPYESAGFNFAETPGDGVWSTNELTSGMIVALAPGGHSAIVARKSRGFYTIYISNMPEYQPGGPSSVDEQWFYNAIIFPAT